MRALPTILILFTLPAQATPTGSCKSWFTRAEIQTIGERCVVACAGLKVDMGTYNCGQQCDELCKVNKHDPDPVDVAVGFFGFTLEELKIVATSPLKATRAYALAKIADDAVDRLLHRNLPNDESDAARHFIWAGLLVKEFGEIFAAEVLAAHEADGSSADPERAMDIHNNREAIETALDLKKKNQLTQNKIETEALKAIKGKRLIVISPKGDVH